jgi:hypothetical protein
LASAAFKGKMANNFIISKIKIIVVIEKRKERKREKESEKKRTRKTTCYRLGGPADTRSNTNGASNNIY